MFKKWLATLVAMALLVGTAMCSLAEGSMEIIPSQIGDVNGDGVVDSSDARLVLQAEVDLVQLTAVQKIAADVNGDGAINSTAARMILQYEVGLTDGFAADKEWKPNPFTLSAEQIMQIKEDYLVQLKTLPCDNEEEREAIQEQFKTENIHANYYLGIYNNGMVLVMCDATVMHAGAGTQIQIEDYLFFISSSPKSPVVWPFPQYGHFYPTFFFYKDSIFTPLSIAYDEGVLTEADIQNIHLYWLFVLKNRLLFRLPAEIYHCS